MPNRFARATHRLADRKRFQRFQFAYQRFLRSAHALAEQRRPDGSHDAGAYVHFLVEEVNVLLHELKDHPWGTQPVPAALSGMWANLRNQLIDLRDELLQPLVALQPAAPLPPPCSAPVSMPPTVPSLSPLCILCRCTSYLSTRPAR